MNARCARSSASSRSFANRRAMASTGDWYRRTSASKARESPARNAVRSSASEGDRSSGIGRGRAVAIDAGGRHTLDRAFAAARYQGGTVLDLRWVVANLDEAKRRLRTRGPAAAEALAPIEELAAERKALIQATETRRAEQKKASERMRTLRGDEQARLRAELKTLSDEVKEKEVRLKEVEERIEAALLAVPNLPHESVPVGTDPAANVVVRSWGEKPRFPFAPRQHDELGEKLGMLDFARAGKVSGARFAFYRGDLARLERALVSFFIDLHRERGYLELIPPYLVNADSMRGTGNLPKFEEDLFKTTSGLYLIPTAEVPVTNYHPDQILGSLPIKYCAFSPCFRTEAA